MGWTYRNPVWPGYFADPFVLRWQAEYFARDTFDERAGTGLAVVRLDTDLLRASDDVRDVVRAHADWQIYERERRHYGRVWPVWHTVEGPCVIAHGAVYYCLYSGGNWRSHDYGVSYARADHPLGPWRNAAGEGPVVLRQLQGEVVGPGHNCYMRAPDGREFLVYHAWDPARTARRMCLDPLVWTPEGPRCLGPTTGERHVG